MKTENGFEEIGKKTTLKAPEGFFEGISIDTLLKAKQRDQKRRKTLILWRTIAVAATLSGLFFLGYYRSENLNSEIKHIVQEDVSGLKSPGLQPETLASSHLVAESTITVAAKKFRLETPVAELSTVLSEMTNDELIQMAEIYKNDLFLGESPQ